jgi:hypothetical protein
MLLINIGLFISLEKLLVESKHLNTVALESLRLLQEKLNKTSANFGKGCIALNSEEKQKDILEITELESEDDDFSCYVFDDSRASIGGQIPLHFGSSDTNLSNNMVHVMQKIIFPTACKFWENCDSEISDDTDQASVSHVNVIKDDSSLSEDSSLSASAKMRKRYREFSIAIMKDKVTDLSRLYKLLHLSYR